MPDTAPRKSSEVHKASREEEAAPPEEASLDTDFCCVICHEVLLDPIRLPCGHTFDLSCVRVMLESARQREQIARRCPICRADLPSILPKVRYGALLSV